MNEMTIENVVFIKDIDGTNSMISCTIDGVQMAVPLDTANRHYAEILRQVEAGTLTIQESN